ncbi:unnamed protein product [Parajaminaea phylloscopi]
MMSSNQGVRSSILDALDAWQPSAPTAVSKSSKDIVHLSGVSSVGSSKSELKGAGAGAVTRPVVKRTLSVSLLDDLGSAEAKGISASVRAKTSGPARCSSGLSRAYSTESAPASSAAPVRKRAPSPRRQSHNPSRLTTLLDASSGHSEASVPDLENWSLEEMQNEARLWGLRSSQDRVDLASKLNAVWSSLCASVSSDWIQQDLVSPPQRPADTSIATPTPAHSRDETRPRPTFADLLADAVQADTQLYRRILLMEPVPFEEIWSLAQAKALFDQDDGHDEASAVDQTAQTASSKKKAAETQKKKKKKVNGGKSRGKWQEEIKTWLDLSGIVWYSATDLRTRTRTKRRGMPR